MDLTPLVTGALIGGIVGYTFRIAEAVRADRVASYLGYLKVVNGFPMNVLNVRNVDDPQEARRAFSSFQVAAHTASTELALVGTTRVVRLARALNESLSKRAVWDAIESLAAAPGDPSAASRFLAQYWEVVSEPRQALVAAMRRDLRFSKLRRVTIDELEGVRPNAASPVP